MAFSKYKHETLVSTFEALIRQQEGELWETYSIVEDSTYHKVGSVADCI